MERNEWVVISYTLPREPSRIRVALWRKLKKTGAVNMQQSVWILPLTDANLRLFNEIKDEVCENSGEAFVMRSSVGEEARNKIINRFNKARDEEYRELIERCEQFLLEIDKETVRKNFIFAEIEENEDDLQKLTRWYEKIKVRDTFGAPLGEKSGQMLEKCVEVLDIFCNKVYDLNEKE